MSTKGDPIPTKYDAKEEAMLRDLKKATGLSMAEIVRRCGRFSLPKFISGEINILTLSPNASDGSSRLGAAELVGASSDGNGGEE